MEPLSGNSINRHRYCVCDGGGIQWGARAAVLDRVRWSRGDVITVKFIDGDPVVHERVKSVASEWLAIASSLQFVFVDSGKAHIRISFQVGNGSWSHLGTACHKVAPGEATMNFGWLSPESPESELRSVVLHEFGHALGLIHEHQNPKGGIRWNRKAVTETLSGHPNYWSPEKIEHNIFANCAASDVTATEVDPTSIMMYAIPSDWTEDGFSTQLNDALSPKDIELVRSIYG